MLLNAAGLYPDELLEAKRDQTTKFLCGQRPLPKRRELVRAEYAELLRTLNSLSKVCMRAYHQTCRAASASGELRTNVSVSDWIFDNITKLHKLPSLTATVYFYAEVAGRRYRCAEIEGPDDEVISSVVGLATPQNGDRLVFGRISHFLLVSYQDTQYELARINWIGYGARQEDTAMYKVSRQPVHGVNALVEVQHLTSPLLHAWEDDVLWVPCCFI